MVLLGLGVLLATLSFFYYKSPATSWTFLPWLQRCTVSDATTKEDYTELKEAPRIEVKTHRAVRHIEDEMKGSATETSRVPADTGYPSQKALEDRKAMPPPPFLSKSSATMPRSPSPPDTPKASSTSSTTSVPSFSLDAFPRQVQEPASQFPAINSAQRASSTPSRTAPPSLKPLAAQPPLRNPAASLMPPPSRSPLPNRNPNRAPIISSPSSGLAPPPTHTTIPSKPRRKVQLTPGHSPLDWATLTRNPSANLSGLPSGTSYLRVPPSLLRQFSGRRKKQPDGTYKHADAWTVLSGKVYNITPYAAYHPGGVEELMKCAGRDGTKLFGEVHPWVNWEGMLEGCLVGVAVSEEEFERVRVKEEKSQEVVGELDEMD